MTKKSAFLLLMCFTLGGLRKQRGIMVAPMKSGIVSEEVEQSGCWPT
jgi:hypothetical protein